MKAIQPTEPNTGEKIDHALADVFGITVPIDQHPDQSPHVKKSINLALIQLTDSQRQSLTRAFMEDAPGQLLHWKSILSQCVRLAA